MKTGFILLFYVTFSVGVYSQEDIETGNSIVAGFYKTNAQWSGALLHLNTPYFGENYILYEENDDRRATVGFFPGRQNFLIKNYNTGFSDLLILEGGNGGKFWMYPDGKLYANNIGDIGAQSNIREMRWNQTTGEIGWSSSSARFKNDILPMKEDWNKILQLEPVTYTRPGDNQTREIGYIAEELQALGLTKLLGFDEQGMPEYIHYDKIILYLVEVIKNQDQKIDAVSDKLDALLTGKIRKNFKGREKSSKSKKK